MLINPAQYREFGSGGAFRQWGKSRGEKADFPEFFLAGGVVFMRDARCGDKDNLCRVSIGGSK